MSRAMKRKHVQRENLADDFSPPTENQKIVKILASKGNNLHEVETADKATFLVSMPTKFRRLMWVKRGDFVVIEPIEEGVKVKGEIVKILTSEHIKYFKQDKVWPEAFDNEKKEESSDIPVNTNRGPAWEEDDDDSSNSSCSDDDVS